MKWYHIILYHLILFQSPLLAGEYSPITKQLKPNSITIIGEIHQHPESIKLFQELIKSYLKNNSCLAVALEINNNQQPIIEKIMQGRAVASDLKISSVIDHAALRNMITDLIDQQRKGACLNILTIDAGDDVQMRRDEWMALNLMNQSKETPILVLLGALHSLKKVNWDLSMTKGFPFVAEILNKQRINVKSYPQIWLDSECNSNNEKLGYRLISNQSDEALNLLNNHFISMMNAYEFNSAIDVADGVIVWEC